MSRTASAVVASATKPSLPFMASLPLMKNEDMSIEDVKANPLMISQPYSSYLVDVPARTFAVVVWLSHCF